MSPLFIVLSLYCKPLVCKNSAQLRKSDSHSMKEGVWGF